MNIERLQDTDDRLFVENDINGECIYYTDEACQTPFNGIVYGMCGKPLRLDYECEIVGGVKDGMELTYNEEGGIEQASECRHNLLYGVSKEYDEEGNLLTASVVFNNSHLKVVTPTESGQYEVTKYTPESTKNLPADILALLILSEEELVNYEFKTRYGVFVL
ncbi:MAG: hypothetical protein Q3983_05080 [Capnocytophaga sp.]|nr:hypothetical protein [Capnocytophaga sp.]